MHPMVKEVLISEEQIKQRCVELATQIDHDYKDCEKAPLFIALLKGSVPFLSELIKYIQMDIQFDFMDVSSYAGTQSTGEIKILKDLDCSVGGLDIVIVEDIIDTGRTLKTVKELMLHRGAKSVKIVTLCDKPARRVVDIKGDYVGFEIPDEFVVGYGLDFDQLYRNLPYVGILKEEAYKGV
ncbi:MAG: hypoxanthine phosphoribosyltransferase [Erysipelotrichaceae bacterium]|nr:hypoxanthine phosphoribosyltransferase [Erysipelotrichaceae bacterium]